MGAVDGAVGHREGTRDDHGGIDRGHEVGDEPDCDDVRHAAHLVEVDVIGRRAVHAGLGVRDHGPDGGGLGLRLVGERACLIVAEDVGGRSVDVLVRRPDRERVAEDAVDGARAEFDDGVDFGEAPRHVGLGRSRGLARQGEEAGEEDVGVEARMDADGEDRVVEEVGHGRCSSVSAQRARIQAG